MHERPVISSFRPTHAWRTGWPYGVWTEVGAQASISDPAAAAAVQDGFGSVHDAADDLVAALRRASGELRITWGELPATRAGTAP